MLQAADCVRIEREKIAVGICFDRGGAGRTVQDRKLAKEIAVAIERQISSRAVVLRKGAGAALFQDVHRPGGLALFNNEVPFLDLHPLQFFDHAAQDRCGQTTEVAKLVEKTLEGADSPSHLHVLFELGNVFREREKIRTIQPQHFH